MVVDAGLDACSMSRVNPSNETEGVKSRGGWSKVRAVTKVVAATKAHKSSGKAGPPRRQRQRSILLENVKRAEREEEGEAVDDERPCWGLIIMPDSSYKMTWDLTCALLIL